MTGGRARSLLGSALGVAVVLAIWWGLAQLVAVNPAADQGHRLDLAGAALLPALSVLSMMIAAQMSLRRWTGAVDPPDQHRGTARGFCAGCRRSVTRNG